MGLQDVLVPEFLWEQICDLIPPHRAGSQGGRPPIDDRACLAGILYVLHTGCPWQFLPVDELACGSYTTCWRRFRDWSDAGVWPKLHQRLLEQLALLGEIDLSLGVVDSASVRALFGGDTPGQAQPIEPKTAANAI